MTIYFISWMLTYFNRRNLPYKARKALSMAILVLPWLKLYLWWFCVSLPLSLKGVIVHFSRPTLKSRKDLEVEQIERFFCAQTLVNDDKNRITNEENTSDIYTLSEIVITTQDFQDILETLDTSKATGPDCFNPTL